MNKGFLKEFALIDGLTTYHYKVVLLLMEKSRTQSQLCEELGVKKQNLNKVCKDLVEYGIVKVTETDGRMKYLAVNTGLKKVPFKGQVKLVLD